MFVLIYNTIYLRIYSRHYHTFLSHLSQFVGNFLQQRRIQNPVEHLRLRFLLTAINYFAKSSILDVPLGSEYPSGVQELQTKKAAGIYLLKVNNRKTRKISEICSKLTIKTPERRH